MLQPAELMVSKLLPTIRARLAQVLIEEYHMKQVEVAKQLGITQAAVSHYITKSRGMDRELVHLFPEIERFVQDMARRITKGIGKPDQVALLNKFCFDLMLTKRFCEYHRRMAALDTSCRICFPENAKP